mmetsp:Transcript_11592/g.29761  ORF Transcript_11592/g.29761 Transcript_11592/m.29761 type:complete len:492 (+) Transcript_11592:339-1814(+)
MGWDQPDKVGMGATDALSETSGLQGHHHRLHSHRTDDPNTATHVVLVAISATLLFLAAINRIRQFSSGSKVDPADAGPTSPGPETKGPSPSITKHAVDRERVLAKFARLYLPAYLCGVFADWMLGPYVYAVYASYGYTMAEIGTLYVVGFVSSLSFGTMMGPLADRYGRRAAALLFCGIYLLSCMCKNVGAFSVLVVGRILGGIGTSLLYTAFESWAVFSLDEAGMTEEDRSQLFALATFGNAMSAVIAGIITYPLNEMYGPVAPFNAAAIPLFVCAAWILWGWTENYGSRQRTMGSSLASGLGAIFQDRRIFVVGLISSFFEAVLYVFVFIWTPSLQLRAGTAEVPLGLVFACYMLSKMCGTYVFEHLAAVARVETVLTLVLMTSAISFAWPIWRVGFQETLVAHCLFEFSVGMYWPAISTLRSNCIGEELRSTTMSLFRVPLNIFVIVCLSGIEALSDVQVYRSCSIAMVFVAICHTLLIDGRRGDRMR